MGVGVAVVTLLCADALDGDGTGVNCGTLDDATPLVGKLLGNVVPQAESIPAIIVLMTTKVK